MTLPIQANPSPTPMGIHAGMPVSIPESSNPTDVLRIAIANENQIRNWSYGEVKKPVTINYLSLKPERDGLFCARIFGPIRDYECLCGKYKRMKYLNVVCEKCGVEVTLTRVRRERMGHIELAAPVVHIWFLKSAPSRIGALLEMTSKELDNVLYFERHVVLSPGTTELNRGQLLTEEEYEFAKSQYGPNSFKAGMGAEAIRAMLAELNLDMEIDKIRTDLPTIGSKARREKMARRLQLLKAFKKARVRPEWMVMNVLPVIPPELRPLVPLDGGRFATSDLNDLYRSVINRNNRLRRIMELNAPDIIVRNEKRMLQEAVDSLLDNGRRGKAVSNNSKRPLKSLADMLKGKHGRFRQNLLGKRVDYSARSVIVVGPNLKLHQCGLPKKMALELFKPFVISKLMLYGLAATVKAAKKQVEMELPEVWDFLADVIREHPVMLNRAPTLHRLGIQAFEPNLIEGKAIQLHPLVCTAFNADFDGDQMAVHVPLSLEAQIEARVLMMSTNNILSPANGKPIIVPSQDIILGIYHLTYARDDLVDLNAKVAIDSIDSLNGAISGNHITVMDAKTDEIIAVEELDGKERKDLLNDLQRGAKNAYKIPSYSSFAEIEHALATGHLHLQQRIRTVYIGVDAQGNPTKTKVSTTPGRAMLASIMPQHPDIKFDLVNTLLTKRQVTNLIDVIYRYTGQKETVIFCDRLMKMGFEWACRAGVSLGKDDLIIPSNKQDLINKTQKEVEAFEKQYQDGLITGGEKYNKVVDAWSTCTDAIANEMMKVIQKPKNGVVNAVFMMADSGARGSATQIKQLAGMRGLMTKPSGEIIERPIISNFKEGLTVLEYFNSTHGARKGLSDTALKTANSGYMTRKLVDVAQNAVINGIDCETEDYLEKSTVMNGGDVIEALSERILGRVLARDVHHAETGELVATRNTLVDEQMADHIESIGAVNVAVRSVITCKNTAGVCARCYGRDLSRGTLVNEGEAVGVIAAQSIGEPGTQLTMRTFHIGGVLQGGTEQSSIEASADGTIKVHGGDLLIPDQQGGMVVMGRSTELILFDANSRERARYSVVYGARLLVSDGGIVKAGQKIVEWDPYTQPIISEREGTAHYVDLEQNISVAEHFNEETGITDQVVIASKKDASLRPRITLRDEHGDVLMLNETKEARYFLPVGAILSIQNGTKVNPGDLLARVPRASSRTRDITGGLPRVSELFEARKPRESAFMTEIAGRIEFGKELKAKRQIIVRGEDENGESISREYMVPKRQQMLVQESDVVKKGENLVAGMPNPHEILRIMGTAALTDYLSNEIQDVYRLQGVKINDKHIEVIVRQMLNKVEILHAGDSHLSVGDQLSEDEVRVINEELEKERLSPTTYDRILMGITKSALQTDSFISAASFQETTRVLTQASVSGRVDHLRGLKENVIVGRLIPAGTGAAMRRLQHEASQRDQLAREAYQLRQEEQERLLQTDAPIEASAESVAPADLGDPAA